MKTTYNPYTTHFPRGKFISRKSIKTIPASSRVHPLCRQGSEPYFQGSNPAGYYHDLGAQDVFLDNAGMLVMEQFPPYQALWKPYAAYIHILLLCWEYLAQQIVPRLPYWGEIFNNILRDANAGEPRGLIRFMGDRNWAQYASSAGRWTETEDSFKVSLDQELPARLEGLLDLSLSTHEGNASRFVDWDSEVLLPPEYATWEISRDLLEREPPSFGGAELPGTFSPTVDRIRILHPLHSTPDLALRVGCKPGNVATYRKRLRDQGSFGTCCAHAVSVGLELLLQRQFEKDQTVSPAWLHCRTGVTVDSGRSLGRVVDTLREQLPCAEDALPYKLTMQQYRQVGHIPAQWETPAIQQSSHTLTQRYGLPWIRTLVPDDISMIKTYLAAGWIVVVSTFLTEEFDNQLALHNLGLPLTPLYGQHRRRDSGHAWLLVGYDHVDGSQQWKYQGRFYALNSWGRGWPWSPIHGPGLCSLPFGMLLTEGIEAFAIRFVEK